MRRSGQRTATPTVRRGSRAVAGFGERLRCERAPAIVYGPHLGWVAPVTDRGGPFRPQSGPVTKAAASRWMHVALVVHATGVRCQGDPSASTP